MDKLLVTRIREQEIFKGVTEIDIQKIIMEIEAASGISLTTRHYNYVSGLLKLDKMLKDNATKMCYNKLS